MDWNGGKCFFVVERGFRGALGAVCLLGGDWGIAESSGLGMVVGDVDFERTY